MLMWDVYCHLPSSCWTTCCGLWHLECALPKESQFRNRTILIRKWTYSFAGGEVAHPLRPISKQSITSCSPCVRPTFDKLQSSLNRLAQLFRTYNSKCYLAIGGSRVQMTNLFEPRNWEPMRQERVATAGFFLDDERPVELGAEFRFHTYIGEGSKDFSLSLAIAWKLGAKSFSMDATIDGHDIGNIGKSHTRYSEMFVQDGQVEHMVTEICRAAMTEIEKRSQAIEQRR